MQAIAKPRVGCRVVTVKPWKGIPVGTLGTLVAHRDFVGISHPAVHFDGLEGFAHYIGPVV